MHDKVVPWPCVEKEPTGHKVHDEVVPAVALPPIVEKEPAGHSWQAVVWPAVA